ncbi:MAG: aspartate carbamoyltransferase catalytic subunit [Vulcanimicrobiaceae bacterium]
MRTRRSLIDLSDLAAGEIDEIFERTKYFEATRPSRSLEDVACVNMFFEHSTRTMTSFTLAEQRLGANVITIWPSQSSLAKGETIEDTAITLGAMGIQVLVIRHPEDGFPARVALAFDGHVVNAGDGTHAHPTQALLDLYTLREEFGELNGRTVAIVGDVEHSRVARSSVHGLQALGADVVLVGPAGFLASDFMPGKARIERDFDAVLRVADAVVVLRIQRERFATMPLSNDEYVARYQLNGKRLKTMRSHAIVMHPGPYNRGVEIDESVLEFAGWRYAKQVMHGVGIRMAVLDFLVNRDRAVAR